MSSVQWHLVQPNFSVLHWRRHRRTTIPVWLLLKGITHKSPMQFDVVAFYVLYVREWNRCNTFTRTLQHQSTLATSRVLTLDVTHLLWATPAKIHKVCQCNYSQYITHNHCHLQTFLYSLIHWQYIFLQYKNFQSHPLHPHIWTVHQHLGLSTNTQCGHILRN